jgi:hypothetical protein
MPLPYMVPNFSFPILFQSCKVAMRFPEALSLSLASRSTDDSLQIELNLLSCLRVVSPILNTSKKFHQVKIRMR